ncbi:MAG: hypothetical protein ACLT98_08575 [Eggerthellaceae bacterium]
MANLLIDAEGTVSLVDFGLAGFFDRNAASPARPHRSRRARRRAAVPVREPRRSAAGGTRSSFWFDDLDLPAAQRSLLLDLFRRPVLHGFASIGDAFEEAFAAPPTA